MSTFPAGLVQTPAQTGEVRAARQVVTPMAQRFQDYTVRVRRHKCADETSQIRP